jgi:hypothetical protein
MLYTRPGGPQLGIRQSVVSVNPDKGDVPAILNDAPPIIGGVGVRYFRPTDNQRIKIPVTD